MSIGRLWLDGFAGGGIITCGVGVPETVRCYSMVVPPSYIFNAIASGTATGISTGYPQCRSFYERFMVEMMCTTQAT